MPAKNHFAAIEPGIGTTTYMMSAQTPENRPIRTPANGATDIARAFGETFTQRITKVITNKKVEPRHRSQVRCHFGIGAPELLRGAVIGRHPDPVDKKISHPKNDKGDYNCENKTLDVHIN